jgi:ribosomal protein S27E
MAHIKYQINDKVGNFIITEEAGRYKIKETDKKVTRFVRVKCIFCEKEQVGVIGKFNSRSVVCDCDKKPKFVLELKNYIGEVHGHYKIIKDLGYLPNEKCKLGRSRYVIAQCVHCNSEAKGIYSVFRKQKRGCVCQAIVGVSGDRKRIYQIYSHMMNRCHNEKNTRFESYGAKGITVCDEWRNDRELFYKWSIENNYDSHLSIDRIKNELGYSPSNCRWSTNAEQVHNRSVSLDLEIVRKIKIMLKNGVKQADICREFKLSPAKISNIKTGTSYSSIIIE